MRRLYLQELFNAYGLWNAKERTLLSEAWKPKIFGAHDTSARIAPGRWYWLPSGASRLNSIVTTQFGGLTYFNEVSDPDRYSGREEHPLTFI